MPHSSQEISHVAGCKQDFQRFLGGKKPNKQTHQKTQKSLQSDGCQNPPLPRQRSPKGDPASCPCSSSAQSTAPHPPCKTPLAKHLRNVAVAKSGIQERCWWPRRAQRGWAAGTRRGPGAGEGEEQRWKRRSARFAPSALCRAGDSGGHRSQGSVLLKAPRRGRAASGPSLSHRCQQGPAGHQGKLSGGQSPS